MSIHSWWKDALCMQGPLGNCSIGAIVLASRVTTSYTGSSSRVPFYLQPTLGGADFDGKDTLVFNNATRTARHSSNCLYSIYR